jgi:hypothetical protein
VHAVNITTADLAINAYSMNDLSTYGFRLSTQNVNGLWGFTTLKLTTSTPPSAGYFSVSYTGSAVMTMLTKVTLSASNWKVPPEDLPLQYQFGYYFKLPGSQPNPNYYILQSYSETMSIDTYHIPPGNVQLVLWIKSTSGSITQVYMDL